VYEFACIDELNEISIHSNYRIILVACIYGNVIGRIEPDIGKALLSLGCVGSSLFLTIEMLVSRDGTV